LISDEVIDLMIPVLFYAIRKRRWLKLHGAPQLRRQPGHASDLELAPAAITSAH
jgi:hypothetical protein